MDRLKHQTIAQRFLNCVNGIICSLNFYIAAPSINDLWGEFICFLNDPNCVARSWDENHWNAQKTPQQRHISSYCTFRLDRKQIRVFSTWFPSCIIAGKNIHNSPHSITSCLHTWGQTWIHSFTSRFGNLVWFCVYLVRLPPVCVSASSIMA